MKLPLMIGGKRQVREYQERSEKGLNSIIILGAWSVWNHRNRCVFDGAPPDLIAV
jgi:hypothetical protein